MTDFNYPLRFEFKIGTLANDFIAKDANGKTLAYVRQKMFKLKEAVSVYTDRSKSEVLYKIKANKWIDYNASYAFTRGEGEESLGRVGRKGRKSILKAHYEVFDTDNDQQYLIQEENPWAKVGDVLFSEIPILGMFTGYIFNPKYLVKNTEGTPIIRLKKEPSFFGRKFSVTKLEDISAEDSERVILSLMMMSLLERRRG
ncbi:MAG: hypothetical protein HRT57_05735 [Crocinitomicaceae bacterium]|nr:hypothetical protein [Crocinitomicaceae bacterium]